MELQDYYWRENTGMSAEQFAAFRDRLQVVLLSWDRTPYAARKQVKGMGVDCVRFVCAVLDEVRGISGRKIETLPNDAAMHTPSGAMSVMRAIRRLYMPNESVLDGSLEPADVIVSGPIAGGPGHAMIVGAEPNVLWHSTADRVQRTGLGYLRSRASKIFRVYRGLDKDLW